MKTAELDSKNLPPTLCHAIEAASADTTHGIVFMNAKQETTFHSWAALARVADAAAQVLQASGLRAGDSCAVIAAEPREFVHTFLALLRCGARPLAFAPAPIMSDHVAYAERLHAALVATGTRHAFFGSETNTSALLEHPLLREHVTLLQVADAAHEPRASSQAPSAQYLAQPDDVCLLQLTSGSTHAPRAVAVTHRNFVENARATHAALATRGQDEVGVSWLPLWHDMGLMGGVVTPLLARSTQVLIAPHVFATSPRIWLEAIHAHAGTITATSNFGLHLALKRMPRSADFHLRSLRTILVGAEPLNPAVLRAFRERFEPLGLAKTALKPAYGLAESTLAVSVSPADAAPKTLWISREPRDGGARAELVAVHDGAAVELVSCGRVIPQHDVQILDDAGNRLADCQIGEIAVTGPSLTAGHWHAHGIEPHALSAGYLRTGDLGFLDHGELYVTGRIKDLIILAGRNLHPQLIEWCVGKLPGARAGAVIAFSVPGTETERLIVLAECETPRGTAALAREIKGCVARELNAVVSDALIVQPFSLPKTTSGKLQRARARELYLANALHTVSNDHASAHDHGASPRAKRVHERISEPTVKASLPRSA